MMEQAKPVDPVANASSESQVHPVPRESASTLFSLHDEALGEGDVSFSNCSDKPALTLVLPEDPAAASCPDEADDAALCLVDDEEFASAIEAAEAIAESDVTDIEDELAADTVALPVATHTEPVKPAADPIVTAPSIPASAGSDIFSTADLRPISQPSRFILPDETPAIVRPAARIEVPKPVIPVVGPTVGPAISAPLTPPSVSVVEVAASVIPDTEATGEKKSPPVRVGSGQLQPTRLNWRPGEPFGDSAASARFRWELMLTTACGTAACGLAGIWLLRTLLS